MFDLAEYQLLGNAEEQKAALERGLVADPTTPDLAWEAGNFYLVQGETDKALREFRVVMESYPPLSTAALKLCWRVKPDVDALLRDVVPPAPAVYSVFLDLLVSQKETSAAARVWTQLAQLRQPLPPQLAFNYIRYLVGQHGSIRPAWCGNRPPPCADCRLTSLRRRISSSTATSA